MARPRFQPDVLLKPDLGSIGLLDWKGSRDRWSQAYEYTVAQIDEIKEKLYATPPNRNW